MKQMQQQMTGDIVSDLRLGQLIPTQFALKCLSFQGTAKEAQPLRGNTTCSWLRSTEEVLGAENVSKIPMWCLWCPDVIQSWRISQRVQPQTLPDDSFWKTPKIIVPHLAGTPSWVWKGIRHFFHSQKIWSLFAVCYPHCLEACNLVLLFVVNFVLSTQAVQTFMLFFFSFQLEVLNIVNVHLENQGELKRNSVGSGKEQI